MTPRLLRTWSSVILLMVWCLAGRHKLKQNIVHWNLQPNHTPMSSGWCDHIFQGLHFQGQTQPNNSVFYAGKIVFHSTHQTFFARWLRALLYKSKELAHRAKHQKWEASAATQCVSLHIYTIYMLRRWEEYCCYWLQPYMFCGSEKTFVCWFSNWTQTYQVWCHVPECRERVPHHR